MVHILDINAWNRHLFIISINNRANHQRHLFDIQVSADGHHTSSVKEHVLTAKAEEVIILVYFKKPSNTNAPVNITSDQETHRILIETTMNLWPHFIAAFMASVLLIMLICKIPFPPIHASLYICKQR